MIEEGQIPPRAKFETHLTDEQLVEKEELVERYGRIYPNVSKYHLGMLYDHIVSMTPQEIEEERKRIETTVMPQDPGGVIDSSVVLADWEEKYKHLVNKQDDEPKPETGE